MSHRPSSGTDLLWAHQLKREHSFLLDRIKTLEEAPSLAIETTASTLEQLQVRFDSLDETVKKSAQNALTEKRGFESRFSTLAELNCRVQHCESSLTTQESRLQDLPTLKERTTALERTNRDGTAETAKTSFRLQNIESGIKRLEANIWSIDSALAHFGTAREEDAEQTRGIIGNLKTIDSAVGRDSEALHRLSRSVSDLLRACQSTERKNLELEKRAKALEGKITTLEARPVAQSRTAPPPTQSVLGGLENETPSLNTNMAGQVRHKSFAFPVNEEEPVGNIVDISRPVRKPRPPSPLPPPQEQLPVEITNQQHKDLPRKLPALLGPDPASSPTHPPHGPRSLQLKHIRSISQATTHDDEGRPDESPTRPKLKLPQKTKPPRPPPPSRQTVLTSPKKPRVPRQIEFFSPRQTRSQTRAVLQQATQVQGQPFLVPATSSPVRKQAQSGNINVIPRRLKVKIVRSPHFDVENNDMEALTVKRKNPDTLTEEQEAPNPPAAKRRRRLI